MSRSLPFPPIPFPAEVYDTGRLRASSPLSIFADSVFPGPRLTRMETTRILLSVAFIASPPCASSVPPPRFPLHLPHLNDEVAAMVKWFGGRDGAPTTWIVALACLLLCTARAPADETPAALLESAWEEYGLQSFTSARKLWPCPLAALTCSSRAGRPRCRGCR